MNNISNSLELIAGKSIPETLSNFFNNLADQYSEETINNLPGWDPNSHFEVFFSEETILALNAQHSDWLKENSEADNAHYVPFSTLEEETDFLVVDISNDDCPILFADHESGQFIVLKNSLKLFLAALDGESTYQMEQIGEVYEEALSDYFEGKLQSAHSTLEAFFDENKVNPGIPGPFMQIIPDALNLYACVCNELDEVEEAMKNLNLACEGIFSQKAYLNRIKINLLTGHYDTVIEQSKSGLSRFNDEYAQAFLNLYRAVALGAQEKEDEAEPFLNLLPEVDGKNDLMKVTPVAAMYTHVLGNLTFEDAYNKTAAVVAKMEDD